MNANELLDKYPRKHLSLYATCVPVAGLTTSAIYDLSRKQISTFPSAYLSILRSLGTHRLREVISDLHPKDRVHAIDFLDWLLSHEYVHITDAPEAFPAISDKWNIPCVVHNAIIDIRERHHDYQRIIHELDTVGCQHIQLRAYSAVFDLTALVNLVKLCQSSSIQSIEAILAYDPSRSDEDYIAVVRENRLVASMLLYGAEDTRQLEVDYGVKGRLARQLATEIRITTQKLDSALDCGHITLRQLVPPTTSTLTELRHFNGCLNRKISVDEHGNVRNCPATRLSFGDHRMVSFSEVVSRESFSAVWKAENDSVQGCSQCPYRYVCTGCRAFLEDPDTSNSKPLKCNYNPISDTWENWRERPNALATERQYQVRFRLPVVRS